MKKISPKYVEGRDVGQSRIPPDQRAQQASADAAQGIQSIAPVVDAAVVTTYAARPINAVDFEIFSAFADGPAIFVVPKGKIAVVTNFSFEFQPAQLVIDVYGFYNRPSMPLVAFTVDDIGVPNYTSLLLGFKLLQHPVYFVAGPEQAIKLVLNNAFAPSLGYVSFYGQLLQDSGRATNYEPGTLYPLPTREVKTP